MPLAHVNPRAGFAGQGTEEWAGHQVTFLGMAPRSRPGPAAVRHREPHCSWLTICFPCKAAFQTRRPRPPLRIIKIVDRAVGKVGACQSATNASLQAADAKHAIDADPRRPRALPSAPGKRPDFIRNHVVFVDFASTHQAISTFGGAAELAHDDCPPSFSSKRQGRPFNLWNLILIGGTSSRT
jgi:hypothetical protein